MIGVGSSMLQRFVAENPDCVVGRPKLALAASVCGGAFLALATGIMVALHGMSHRAPGSLVVGGALVAVGLVIVRGWIGKLSVGVELMRRGHGCYAVGKEELLLVDTAGSALLIRFDAIASLDGSDGDVRLRVDPDQQGRVYAVLFDLFDEDGPGPSGDQFFDLIAPILRSRGVDVVDDAAYV